MERLPMVIFEEPPPPPPPPRTVMPPPLKLQQQHSAGPRGVRAGGANGGSSMARDGSGSLSRGGVGSMLSSGPERSRRAGAGSRTVGGGVGGFGPIRASASAAEDLLDAEAAEALQLMGMMCGSGGGGMGGAASSLPLLPLEGGPFGDRAGSGAEAGPSSSLAALLQGPRELHHHDLPEFTWPKVRTGSGRADRLTSGVAICPCPFLYVPVLEIIVSHPSHVSR